jgi:hypothetical protein
MLLGASGLAPLALPGRGEFDPDSHENEPNHSSQQDPCGNLTESALSTYNRCRYSCEPSSDECGAAWARNRDGDSVGHTCFRAPRPIARSGGALLGLRGARDGNLGARAAENVIGLYSVGTSMAEYMTLAFSDSALYRPRKIDEPVPVAGYLILPPATADQIPRMGTLEFEGHPGAHYPALDAVPTFVGNTGELRVTPSASTATAAVSMPTDYAFLADATNDLPASIEEIAHSKAGRGLVVWDLLAHYSALRRLKRLGVSNGTIIFRTDGELPEWVSGSKQVTADVNGRNIAPALVKLIRESEATLPPVRRETVQGWNVAEGPIRQVIARGRRDARRVDLELAGELGPRARSD